jgi:hypothetical protein
LAASVASRTGLRPIRSDSRPQKGDLPRLGLQALGEEGQQRHHQAEPDQIDEHH